MRHFKFFDPRDWRSAKLPAPNTERATIEIPDLAQAELPLVTKPDQKMPARIFHPPIVNKYVPRLF